MSITRINPAARYADAVTHGGVVYAVEVPAREDGDIRTQTRSLLAALEQTLLKSGSSKTALLMATIYLTDMSDYEALNAEWEAWLPAGSAPARACVQVAALARPGWRVEIAVTAALS